MARKAIITIAVVLLTAAMLYGATVQVNGGLPGAKQVSNDSINAVVKQYAALAKEAYLYAQPLLLTYGDMYADIADDSTPDYIGAFNNLRVRAVVESEFNQSININAWLDLRTEPLLLRVPRGGRERGVLEIVDLYGDTIARTPVSDTPSNYLIVARDWDGKVPLGISKVFTSKTDLVHVYSNTRVANAIAFERLKEWSEAVALVPMSAYTMQLQPKLAHRLLLPEWDENLLETTQFILYLNFMLKFLHPQAEEASQLARFERIGIVEGLPRAPRRYSGAISAGIAQAVEELEKRGRAESVATIGQI